MKIAIVGGCFTNQHNIPFESLYHQTLKRELDKNRYPIEIQTIRYERISKCLEKIEELSKSYTFDLLIFHLRAEPIMRISKLYYKYLNADGELGHSLNIPFLKLANSEKFDLLSLNPSSIHFDEKINETRWYHFLREANYYTGNLIGNKWFALKLLRITILRINNFCLENNIKFLLLGPVSRPFSKFENSISEEINIKFKTLAGENSINYLELIKKSCKNNESMFFENGIHVSQAGHDEIASLLLEKLLKENLASTK